MSDPYDGQSTDPNVPGITGQNTAAGIGVFGESTGFEGVRGIGHSPDHAGVAGINDGGSVGVFGESTESEGVRGVSHTPGHGGVVGINVSGGIGVSGSSIGGGVGVFGESTEFEGVTGVSHAPGHGAVVGKHVADGIAVYGETNNGDGVFGRSTANGRGVVGVSDGHTGVEGNSTTGSGVFGSSQSNPGVEAHSTNGPGVFATGNPAGLFEGNVTVTGDVTLTGADCAEEFDVSGATDVEPGTVMVLDQEGALQPSQQAYDKRVAGVISGAGNYKPGIVLDKQQSSENRMPVALVGKVYCKVDAQYASVEVGDLLTTSLTPGHAMKAGDPLSAFGAVIGKALRPLKEGQGLIPILIALQ